MHHHERILTKVCPVIQSVMPTNRKNDERKTHEYKICEIVEHATMAGTERHVLLLASRLNRELFTISVCIFEQGELADRLRAQGIETTVIPNSHTIWNFMRLIVFLFQRNFAIVHCHSGGYACIAARIAGVKRVIYTKHGIGFTSDELKRRNFLRKLRDLFVDKCTYGYIALTNYDKKVMSDILHIDPKKIEIIHNGIDPSFGEKTTTRRGNHPVIGTVARLTEQKGIQYLIQAVPEILAQYRTTKVLIAGSGEEEMQLRNLAKSLGVSENIEFLGYVDHVAELLSKMDIFILPSIWEGFPYVLLEAMFLKKPIVATDIFGINEIIDNNVNGILVEPRNSFAIAKSVIDLLSNEHKSAQIGNAAYNKVSMHFTLSVTTSKIEKLYLRVLENVSENHCFKCTAES